MEFKLEKEFGQRWLAALRSGEYEQGESYLQNNSGKYCCLGVACRMDHPEEDLLHKFFIDSSGVEYNKKNYISRNLERSMPELLRGGNDSNEFVRLVADMNDTGKSFAYIADWIETHVEFV